jgi:hypothetical protein
MLSGDFNTPIVFCDITHQCFAGKKLKNLNFSASGIDRFHSRDWWPQWGGETIRNI